MSVVGFIGNGRFQAEDAQENSQMVTKQQMEYNFTTLSTGIFDALSLSGDISFGTITSLKKFVATHVIFRTHDVDTILSLPTISIGTNSTDYNDLFTATMLVSLDANNKVFIRKVADGAVLIPAGTELKAKVTVAASATKCDLIAEVMGYYVDNT